MTCEETARGTALILLILLGSAPRAAFSAPDALQYELQERCGRRAAEVFEKDHAQAVENVEDGQTISSYRNHYDPDLNKCFILETTVYVGTKKGVRVTWKAEVILDVNTNKEYGNFLKNTSDAKGVLLKPDDDSRLMICTVWGLRCMSESQWDQMIGRYMGDHD